MAAGAAAAVAAAAAAASAVPAPAPGGASAPAPAPAAAAPALAPAPAPGALPCSSGLGTATLSPGPPSSRSSSAPPSAALSGSDSTAARYAPQLSAASSSSDRKSLAQCWFCALNLALPLPRTMKVTASIMSSGDTAASKANAVELTAESVRDSTQAMQGICARAPRAPPHLASGRSRWHASQCASPDCSWAGVHANPKNTLFAKQVLSRFCRPLSGWSRGSTGVSSGLSADRLPSKEKAAAPYSLEKSVAGRVRAW